MGSPLRAASMAAFLPLLGMLPTVCAFFEQLFSGGGQQIHFEQMGGQRQQRPKWPKGVSDECSKPMSWLKGTEWAWNRDGWTLKLEKDGDVDAPINQCRRDSCRWTAENGKLYIQLGGAGLHTFSTEQKRPANMDGMRMTGKDTRGSTIKLSFEKIFDHSAVDFDKDIYEILGIPDDADDAQIKKVYRKMSIKYHPDKNPDEESRRKFADIRDAYEVLSDPDKKILYDTGGMEAVKKLDKGEVDKTNDVNAEIEVGIEDLYLGNEQRATIKRGVVCRGCRNRPDSPNCKGCKRCADEVRTQNVQMGPFMTQQQVNVPSKEKCKKEDATIEVQIEQGMRDGEVLTFARMAEERPGMLPGSVLLKLKMRKGSKFVRKGNDLHLEMHISLRESLLGWSQTIRHIDGHKVELSTTDVTKHLQVFKIKSEGMPLRDDPASFGDLFVKVHVDFPKSIPESSREGVKKIFSSPIQPRQEL